MSKRPSVDMAGLVAETSQEATPMHEATQRTSRRRVKTADLKPLAFKVPPAFDKRFRKHAFDADLKLNELLYEALDAWEEKKRLSKN